jgi:hypothetical protein
MREVWNSTNALTTTCRSYHNIELKKYLFEYGLKADQQYLVCKTTGTTLPLPLVVGNEECQLFERLVVTAPQRPINLL